MAVNKDQVKKLLGSGLPAETVASAVGCDPSYVSQLLGDDDFAAEVATLRSQALMSHTARDNTANEIEQSLLNKIKEAVDQHLIFKPKDLLHAYAVINKAVRRGAHSPTSLPAQTTVVQIALPVVTARQFVTNKVGEVIEADGQSLVTMPARDLLTSLSKQRGQPGEDKYERARRYIPGAQVHLDSGTDESSI